MSKKNTDDGLYSALGNVKTQNFLKMTLGCYDHIFDITIILST